MSKPRFRPTGWLAMALLTAAAAAAPAASGEAARLSDSPFTVEADRVLVAWADASIEAALRDAPFSDAAPLGDMAGLRYGVRAELRRNGRLLAQRAHDTHPTLAANLRVATVELVARAREQRLPADVFRRADLVLTFHPRAGATADDAGSALPMPELVAGVDGVLARLGQRAVLFTPPDLWNLGDDPAGIFDALAHRLRAPAPAGAPTTRNPGDPGEGMAWLLRQPGFRLERVPSRVLVRLAPEPELPAPAADAPDRPGAVARLYRHAPLRSADTLNAAGLARSADAARAWLVRRARTETVERGLAPSAPDRDPGAGADEDRPPADPEVLLYAALFAGSLRADARSADPAGVQAAHDAASRCWEQALTEGYREHPVNNYAYFRDRNGERSIALTLLALRVLGQPAFAPADDPAGAERRRIAAALARYAAERGKRSAVAADPVYQAERLLAADALADADPATARTLLGTRNDAAPAAAPLSAAEWLAAFSALTRAGGPGDGNGFASVRALPEAVLAGVAVYRRTRREEAAGRLRAWCGQLMARQALSPDWPYGMPAGTWADEEGSFDQSVAGGLHGDPGPGATARSTWALATAAKLFALLGDREPTARCALATQHGARALRQRQALDRFDLAGSGDPGEAAGGVRLSCASGFQELGGTALAGRAFQAMGEGLDFGGR